MTNNVLILGGTEDSLQLHQLLAENDITATLSLAGRTKTPASLPPHSRIGGFGGAEGFAAFLGQHATTLLVDATHPFAAQISKNAVAAARTTGTPLLRLSRPAWEPAADDRWLLARNEQEAAQMLPTGGRAFLALGAQRLTPFAARTDVEFIVRVVDAPHSPLLPFPHEVVIDRGPFVTAAERELLRRRAISHIVVRNSGGVGAIAKIEAARDLHLPVVMIVRPETDSLGNACATVDNAIDACAWVIDHLG